MCRDFRGRHQDAQTQADHAGQKRSAKPHVDTPPDATAYKQRRKVEDEESKWDDKPEQPSRGRDFFGGDLRGVINKLDYIADLGISCIYFTPIFAARTNHRYDAVDYTQIDPRLGTEDDLRELISFDQQLLPWSVCGLATLYSGCYTAALLFATWLVFRRKPLNQ